MTIARTAIIDYIIANFGLEEDEFEDSTLLFSEGLLDSFCMVNLIAFVEGEAGFTFRPTEVNLDNLDSVERIVEFVGSKMQ